jgi:HSP20 family protein
MKEMTETQPEKKRESVPVHAEPEPLLELENAVAGVRGMLEQTFAGMTGWPAVRYGEIWSPPVEIEETDDAYLLEVELPGVQRKNVDIEIVGRELNVTGEAQEKERVGVVRRSTRRSGRFAYHVTLPEPVDAAEVEATLADGVLKMRVPKSERSQPHKVQLKTR